ncbi:hypothetical protein LMH87_002074 [Akanthomyces muscarius]|uniref:J domain-containing protein n=1 Tax=Akanthomyces muscarius TaxID=2231603 RepID=A0A9W8UIW2_AKAMU|nr:hypothetical protein LMH87_002074 [Akanthomyces muscarius]KAJ4147562.1 hypothetical protein LMH87_002074 [Akanthomyces muscarius]
MHFSQAARKSHRLFASHQRGNTKRRYSSSSRAPPRIVWPADTKPTPYQVLNIDASQPYEKSSFNRMVKLYHPDMHHHHGGDVSPQARLHRYYLIVAAHELLSNPEQRRRYDLYKMGWMNHVPATAMDDAPSRRRASWPSEAERYADADADGSRPSPMRQSPIYMSNGAFAILLLVFAFGYAIVSYERVRRAAWREKRRMHLVDRDIVKTLYDARHLVEGKSKDERILAFLCRRHVASGANEDDGGFLPLDRHWEQNICRH